MRKRALNAFKVLVLFLGMALTLAVLAQDFDWKRGKLERLAPLIGTYRYAEVFADPEVADALEALLPPATLPVVRRNLQTMAPIDFIAGHLVLSGNRAHYGGEEMAWVWLSIYDGTAKVVLLHEGTLALFAVAERYEYLPLPLRSMVAAPPPDALYQPPAGLRWSAGANSK